MTPPSIVSRKVRISFSSSVKHPAVSAYSLSFASLIPASNESTLVTTTKGTKSSSLKSRCVGARPVTTSRFMSTWMPIVSSTPVPKMRENGGTIGAGETSAPLPADARSSWIRDPNGLLLQVSLPRQSN